MREKSEKRRYYKRRNEKLPLILLPIISMNIYHLCRKVSHITCACLLFKLWYTYSFVTHFFHSKISWLSFHVNEHISLFHSIFNRCLRLPVGVTHPSSAPPSHRPESCQPRTFPTAPSPNHSQQDPGRTSHPNWPRLLSLSRNLESRPGESWASLEMVPGKFWHCVVVIFCHVGQDTPVCEEKEKESNKEGCRPSWQRCTLSPNLSQHLTAPHHCLWDTSVSLNKASFITWSCLKYINSGNQKIPSNHYSKETRKRGLSTTRPGLWKPIKRIHKIEDDCPSTFYKPLFKWGDTDWNANCSRGGLHSRAVRASTETTAPTFQPQQLASVGHLPYAGRVRVGHRCTWMCKVP